MSDDILEKYIKQHIEASSEETVFFSWHGGEPTLLGVEYFRRIVALERKHAPPGCPVANGIQTNGILLDEEWCRFFAAEAFAVATLARFYKIAPQEILVVHDELDLLPGQAKLKFGGSAAGHNGLKDIHAMLGTLDFWRLRLGIGHPGVKSEVVNYVLKRPSPDHRDAIQKAIEQSLQASELLLAGEMDKALARIHAQPPRPKPPRPARPPADEPGDDT